MDPRQFDALSRSLFTRQSRRAAASLLGGVLALQTAGPVTAGGKKGKKRKNKKQRDKKAPACVPFCGDRNNRCNEGDGCGGRCTCGSGSLCDGGFCHPCDVVHDGNDLSSGDKLRQELSTSTGTIRVCPGRYVGYFPVNRARVLGAGDGSDPQSNTILDARGAGNVPAATRAVLTPAADSVEITLSQLRITGSTTPVLHGLYVPTQVQLTLETCTVTENRGDGVYGIMVNGTLDAQGSTISSNGPLSPAVQGGGGLYVDTTAAAYMEDCRVIDNQAYTSNGGGITLFSGLMSIFSTEISGNRALGGPGYRGGGLYSNYGTVSMNSGTRITGNSAGAGGGGGIFRENRGDQYPIDLNGATVSGNSPDNCRNVTGCSG